MYNEPPKNQMKRAVKTIFFSVLVILVIFAVAYVVLQTTTKTPAGVDSFPCIPTKDIPC